MTKSSATRLLRNFILSALAALSVLIVTIRAQQYVLRWRSKQLLGQIRALDVGRATFADAQRIFRQWPSARDTDPCVLVQCDFEIRLSDFCDSHFGFCVDHPRLLRVYEFLGGRSSNVFAGVSVRDGLVKGESFRVNVEVVPHETDLFGPYGYGLIANASTVQAIDTGTWPRATSHPQYLIGQPSGCEICVMVFVNFTTRADPADIQRLMQFDLSCLTRWRAPCRTQGDIMPAAWKQAQDERAASPTH